MRGSLIFEDNSYPYSFGKISMRSLCIQEPRYWLPYRCYKHVREIRKVLEAARERYGPNGRGWCWDKKTQTLFVSGLASDRSNGNAPFHLQQFGLRYVENWTWKLQGDHCYRFLERLHLHALEDIPRILACGEKVMADGILPDHVAMMSTEYETRCMLIQDIEIPYLMLRLELGI